MNDTIIQATAARNGITGINEIDEQKGSSLRIKANMTNVISSTMPMTAPMISAWDTFTPIGGVGKI